MNRLSGEHFRVALDEITYPLIYGWMPFDNVQHTLKTRTGHVYVVLTGRRCPPEIIAVVNALTERTMVKQAIQSGLAAQRGIEN